MPAVALFGGLAVLVFGLLPRLTVAISVAATGLAYVIELFGTAVGLPAALLDLSPFHHVSAVPAESFDPLAAAVLLGLAVLTSALGLLGFGRRDLAAA